MKLASGMCRILISGCAGNLRSRAFSLVELMVTIVIIALLVGFIVPNVVDYFRQTRVTVLQYQLRTIRSALVKYARDNHGAYPRALNRLVDGGYLSEMPVDPFASDTDTWEIIVGSVEVQFGMHGKRVPFYAWYNSPEHGQTPLGPYHILPRATAAPYYDPPRPDDPSPLVEPQDYLYWSNMGIINVRSGASLFKTGTFGERTDAYARIDPHGANLEGMMIEPVNPDLNYDNDEFRK